jgi:hypothetical protein
MNDDKGKLILRNEEQWPLWDKFCFIFLFVAFWNTHRVLLKTDCSKCWRNSSRVKCKKTIAERKLEYSSVGFWGADVTRVRIDQDLCWENTEFLEITHMINFNDHQEVLIVKVKLVISSLCWKLFSNIFCRHFWCIMKVYCLLSYRALRDLFSFAVLSGNAAWLCIF